MNPGTVESYCNNTLISCFNDNECGINGLIGNNYCAGINVVKDYLTFKWQ